MPKFQLLSVLLVLSIPAFAQSEWKKPFPGNANAYSATICSDTDTSCKDAQMAAKRRLDMAWQASEGWDEDHIRLALEKATMPVDWQLLADTYFRDRATRIAERDRWNRVKAQYPPVEAGTTITSTCTSYHGRYGSSSKCLTKVQ